GQVSLCGVLHTNEMFTVPRRSERRLLQIAPQHFGQAAAGRSVTGCYWHYLVQLCTEPGLNGARRGPEARQSSGNRGASKRCARATSALSRWAAAPRTRHPTAREG